MAKRKVGRICLNPSCRTTFTPGHYGCRQKVGSGKDHIASIQCPSCKGFGEKHGEQCRRCKGEKKIRQTCQEWYRIHWAQVRKPPRGIPKNAFAKIEQAVRPDRLRHACLIAARESGLRKGELLGLTWGDILGHDGKVKESFDIRGQWDDSEGFKVTKTAGSRIGYFLPKAVEVISKLETGKSNDRVFPFWESRIYTWFISIQKRLGIRNPETGYEYRWHDLRHSLGTELVHGHGDKGLAVAAQVLGHKSINTTRGYSELSAKELIKEALSLRRRKP